MHTRTTKCGVLLVIGVGVVVVVAIVVGVVAVNVVNVDLLLSSIVCVSVLLFLFAGRYEKVETVHVFGS